MSGDRQSVTIGIVSESFAKLVATTLNVLCDSSVLTLQEVKSIGKRLVAELRKDDAGRRGGVKMHQITCESCGKTKRKHEFENGATICTECFEHRGEEEFELSDSFTEVVDTAMRLGKEIYFQIDKSKNGNNVRGLLFVSKSNKND